jgi:hypothetical protein
MKRALRWSRGVSRRNCRRRPGRAEWPRRRAAAAPNRQNSRRPPCQPVSPGPGRPVHRRTAAGAWPAVDSSREGLRAEDWQARGRAGLRNHRAPGTRLHDRLRVKFPCPRWRLAGWCSGALYLKRSGALDQSRGSWGGFCVAGVGALQSRPAPPQPPALCPHPGCHRSPALWPTAP